MTICIDVQQGKLQARVWTVNSCSCHDTLYTWNLAGCASLMTPVRRSSTQGGMLPFTSSLCCTALPFTLSLAPSTCTSTKICTSPKLVQGRRQGSLIWLRSLFAWRLSTGEWHRQQGGWARQAEGEEQGEGGGQGGVVATWHLTLAPGQEHNLV